MKIRSHLTSDIHVLGMTHLEANVAFCWYYKTLIFGWHYCLALLVVKIKIAKLHNK